MTSETGGVPIPTGCAAALQPNSVDVVYTWVDDSFPGYAETLRAHATDSRDTNPNRTRDNLDLLRYSLRSLEACMPFVRKIHIVSCRPQVPAWLDAGHPDIRIIHHDQIMAPELLPTFNSFAIVSHLTRIPDLSPRFLYFEDDMLAFRPLKLEDFSAADGRAKVFLEKRAAPVMSQLDPASSSPWNLALARANHVLKAAFGAKAFSYLAHGPQLIDRDLFARMCERFADDIATTRRSRFRAHGNVPPEYLYPHFALETAMAIRADSSDVRRMTGYASLENWYAWTWLQLRRLEWRKPATITLNDSFGNTPNPRVVAHVRKTLERWFPVPSRFEKTVHADGTSASR
ncbi:stealth conserved region 3 domain-containing protein [Stappia sp.]|uniref:stealth conserved region 3 domain-containing protein n=1 Tax=Stappia sp. TaxID=1870903 RepID=UPI003A9A31E7